MARQQAGSEVFHRSTTYFTGLGDVLGKFQKTDVSAGFPPTRMSCGAGPGGGAATGTDVRVPLGGAPVSGTGAGGATVVAVAAAGGAGTGVAAARLAATQLGGSHELLAAVSSIVAVVSNATFGTRILAESSAPGYLAVIVATVPLDAPWQPHAAQCEASVY